MPPPVAPLPRLRWRLALVALAALVLAGTGAPSAFAAPAKNWAIEYEPSLEYNTNLQQQAGGVPDLILRNNLEFSFLPVQDNDNSVLLRLQALNSRFISNPDFDSTFILGTALASRRLFNSLYGYGGYQSIFKQGTGAGAVNRLDGDLFGGTVVYRSLSDTNLVFHGYQFDYLRAAISDTSYVGHSAYVTLRNATTERWTNSLSLRSQLRLYDQIGQLEWRNIVTADSQYRLYPWWSLLGEVIYLNATASQAAYTFSGWNLGLFSRFSY